MGKLSKKLVVYLDQNFISEMAKAGINENVNPSFRRIYELLHQGFEEEKTVVPVSWFHEIETSLDTRLKERITRYQGYLGQLTMNHPNDLLTFQMVEAAQRFLGQQIQSQAYSFAYHDDPDDRVERFGVSIDLHLERILDYRSARVKNADILNGLRGSVAKNKTTFEQQRDSELAAASQQMSTSWNYINRVNWVFHQSPEKLKEFAVSPEFLRIPIIHLSANFWAKLLVDFNSRTIKSSDPMDVEIISTLLPYVDVFATDTFMATQIKNFGYDSQFETEVFDSSKNGLRAFELYLEKYLSGNPPVNKPSASVFIIPDKRIREESFDFFKSICVQNLGRGRPGHWVEVYAFDDGHMPRYEYPRTKGEMPFYGLQDVEAISVQAELSHDELLKICRERSRSEHFVVIDSYRNIPGNFTETLLNYIQAGKSLILGYKIYDSDSAKIPSLQ